MATTTGLHAADVINAAFRLEHVRYAIRDIAVAGERLAREGKKILPLNIGDPLKFDFATPPHLIEAVARAMRDGHNGYAPSPGIPQAIEAIRRHAEQKGIRDIRSVFVTQGVSEAVDVCLTALLNPGESVLTPCPEYPLYSAVLAKLEATPNPYPLDEAQGWAPNLQEVEKRITPRTRGMVVINPNNPTGAVYPRATLEALAEIARRRRLVVFADEIYDRLILDGEPHTPFATIAPDLPVITFNGLSKAYLAPGWRVGWGIASGGGEGFEPYLEGIQKLLRARLSANTPQQYAIREALEGPQDHLQSAIAKLRQRRDQTMAWCRQTPRVECVSPRGAFYAFPRLNIPEPDSVFVRELLQHKQVMVVHGSGFGEPEGGSHFRIVFLPDEATLGRAYEGIAELLNERYGAVSG